MDARAAGKLARRCTSSAECRHEAHRLGGLDHRKRFPTVQEARSPRARCRQAGFF